MDYRVCIVTVERRLHERETTFESQQAIPRTKNPKRITVNIFKVYMPPSLKDAKKRGKEEVKLIRF